jgi:nucleoside 2-deoxyribosyltransferase
MKTIYLAGLISTDFPESLRWRERMEPLLADYFNVLSPMRGKKELEKRSKDGGLNDPGFSSKDIILRDYNDIRECDLTLVHLENFGSSRPLIGTIAELAWLWQMQKPVIAIAHADNVLMRSHPFIKEMIAHYLESEDAALGFLATRYR